MSAATMRAVVDTPADPAVVLRVYRKHIHPDNVLDCALRHLATLDREIALCTPLGNSNTLKKLHDERRATEHIYWPQLLREFGRSRFLGPAISTPEEVAGASAWLAQQYAHHWRTRQQALRKAEDEARAAAKAESERPLREYLERIAAERQRRDAQQAAAAEEAKA